jgi:hypothetical protein
VRFSSGTTGFFMIACSGSTDGAGGTRVRPAPSRADRSRWDPEWTRRVTVEPPVSRCEPSAVEYNRHDARVMVEAAPAGAEDWVGTDAAPSIGDSSAPSASAPAASVVGW